MPNLPQRITAMLKIVYQIAYNNLLANASVNYMNTPRGTVRELAAIIIVFGLQTFDTIIKIRGW